MLTLFLIAALQPTANKKTLISNINCWSFITAAVLACGAPVRAPPLCEEAPASLGCVPMGANAARTPEQSSSDTREQTLPCPVDGSQGLSLAPAP